MGAVDGVEELVRCNTCSCEGRRERGVADTFGGIGVLVSISLINLRLRVPCWFGDANSDTGLDSPNVLSAALPIGGANTG